MYLVITPINRPIVPVPFDAPCLTLAQLCARHDQLVKIAAILEITPRMQIRWLDSRAPPKSTLSFDESTDDHEARKIQLYCPTRPEAQS